MARPTKDGLSPVTLRLNPATIAQIDDAAKAAELTREAWIARAIQRDLVPLTPRHVIQKGPSRFQVRPEPRNAPVGFDAITGKPVYR